MAKDSFALATLVSGVAIALACPAYAQERAELELFRHLDCFSNVCIIEGFDPKTGAPAGLTILKGKCANELMFDMARSTAKSVRTSTADGDTKVDWHKAPFLLAYGSSPVAKGVAQVSSYVGWIHGGNILWLKGGRRLPASVTVDQIQEMFRAEAKKHGARNLVPNKRMKATSNPQGGAGPLGFEKVD